MCYAGRDKFDACHPTCRSCQLQGIDCKKPKKGRARRTHTSGVVLIDGELVLVCGTDLRSPNDWNNSLYAHAIYTGEKRKWLRLCRNIKYAWGEQQPGVRRRLQVTRKVPSSNYLIKDFGNRVFTLKPVEDALKASGVIIDDSEDYLESLPPEQIIDRTLKEPLVEIRLTDIKADVLFANHPAVAPGQTATHNPN